MNLPTLDQWERTRDSLQRAALVMNAVRIANSAPQRNHLHHSLWVTTDGLTTGALNNGGTLRLMFGAEKLAYNAGATNLLLDVSETTQVKLADALAKAGVAFDRAKLTDETDLWVSARHAVDFAQALNTIYSAIARFRGRLYGTMTPMVLWPHHFDLSFLWFATPEDDEYKAHLNFGFSPGAGAERPYFYVTAYPQPDGLTTIALPAPARWHTDGWTGVRVEYDALRSMTHGDIEFVYDEVYRLLAPLMKGLTDGKLE